MDVSNELNIYKYDNEGKLDEIMQRYGFKVNRKKIGVLG